jgi:hypothetical protein
LVMLTIMNVDRMESYYYNNARLARLMSTTVSSCKLSSPFNIVIIKQGFICIKSITQIC